MTDNVVAGAAVGTGPTFATDDVGGTHYPIGKIAYGALDSVTLAASGAGAVSAGVQRVTLASDDPAVAALAKLGGVVSTANSTTSNLGSGAAFTGTSEDVSNYAAILVSAFSSHASGTDGLSIQQSSDGTNWDITDAYTIAAATGKTFSFQPAAKFYRLVYTNGATLTTSLRIQTVFHYATPKGSSQRPQDALSNENDFEQISAFLQGYNGTTWDRLRTVNTGMLQVAPTFAGTVSSTGAGASGAQTQRVVTATDSTIGTVTTVTTVSTVTNVATIGTSVTPGTAATNLGKAEDAGHTTGDVGVMALAVRTDTLAARATTDADYIPLTTDSLGALWTRDATALVDDAAFTPGTSRVMPLGLQADETATDLVDEGDVGAPRMTLDRKQIVTIQAHTAGGTLLNHSLAPATPAKNVITAAASQLYGIVATNILATPVYLKIWDLATGSVTLGTTACTYQFMIPGNTAGAGFTIAWPQGIPFTNGIITAVTGAISATDNTSTTANSIVINVTYK